MAKIWSVGEHEAYKDIFGGWRVGNTWHVGYIETSDTPTIREIIQKLKELGVVSKYAKMASFLWDGDDMVVNIDYAKDGRPAFILEAQTSAE
jgi:hypothetical protein